MSVDTYTPLFADMYIHSPSSNPNRIQGNQFICENKSHAQRTWPNARGSWEMRLYNSSVIDESGPPSPKSNHIYEGVTTTSLLINRETETQKGYLRTSCTFFCTKAFQTYTSAHNIEPLSSLLILSIVSFILVLSTLSSSEDRDGSLGQKYVRTSTHQHARISYFRMRGLKLKKLKLTRMPCEHSPKQIYTKYTHYQFATHFVYG